MKDKKLPDDLQCISCGVSHLFDLNTIKYASNKGRITITIILEWTCEQCKTINHFPCYGIYVNVNPKEKFDIPEETIRIEPA